MVEKLKSSSLVHEGHIEFHYQKSPLYRSIHCDGFYGGTTPRGYVAVSFFNERGPIPRQAVRRVISKNDTQITAGEEQVLESLRGIVRHVESTVFMDLNTARDFYEWLGESLKNLEEISKVKPKRKSEATKVASK
jgi:hypothetical protein